MSMKYLFSLTGGDAALTDEMTADGQNGVSFIHPVGEIYLPPLAGEWGVGKAHSRMDSEQKADERNVRIECSAFYS